MERPGARDFFLGLAFLLCVCCALEALDANKRFSHFVHRAWGAEQGLPQNSVYSILQTRDGYLWLALEGGLARFDGVRFVVFNKQNTPELTHNFIWNLYEAKDGSLWIGTEGGGLVRFKDGEFSSWTTKQGFPDDFVRAITEDAAGNLWVGTKNGLVRFKNGIGKFEVFNTSHGLPSNRIRALFTDSRGTVWAGSRDGGLIQIRDGKFKTFTTTDGLLSSAIVCISQDPSGDLWIGTEGGLSRLEEKGITTFTTKDGLSNDIVRSLFRDSDGVLWIGTEGGLDRMTNGKISAFAPNKEFNAEMIISMFEDREKNLWLGTFGGGLHNLRNAKIKTLTTADGLTIDWAVSVYENRAGEFWIGTYGSGLNRIHTDQVTSLTTKDGLLNDYVISFAEDSEGAMWIGTYGGLNRWKDGKFSSFTTKNGLANDAVGALFVDREGVLWIGTDQGINRMQNDRFSSLSMQDGLLDLSIYFFYQDRSGNIWIGTGGGLNRFHNGKVTGYKAAQGLTNDGVYFLYEDQQNDLWIGTGSGLYRMRNGKFTQFTTKNGLIDDGVFTILEDNQGNFWMSSVKGVFRIRKQELNDFADGKIAKVNPSAYGLPDGLKTLECTSGTQPSAWKARDGKFWYTTGAGVSILDPREIPTNEVLPPVLVEEVVADGNVLKGQEKRIVLQPGTKNFEFRYSALSYRVPERVKFRYKMEGYDPDWVDAGTRRTAYYTNLSPAEYTFRVIAANDDGVWNETGSKFAFYLKPYFYQTKWFYVLCILAAVATGFAAQRYRVASLKKIVAIRTQELSNSNQKLLQAQERITKLLEGKPHGLENMTAWSQSVAKDIADVVGADSIRIWVRDGEIFHSVGQEMLAPPSLDEVKNASADSSDRSIVAVTGSSGQIFGALTIAGGRIVWGETEKRLISGLANQLGSALEIKKMQEELASSHQRKAATMQQMHDQGIATMNFCAHCGRCYEHTVINCPTDGTALQSPQILPFKILNRYRLTRLLGQGGTGTVYQAYDEKLKRFVAVKVLRKEFADDPFMRGRWEREAHMVARLHHPGIVELHDIGELTDSSAFFVMEFLQGVDLARILKEQGPASPSQVAEILQQVGSALSTAHAAGVIHRDLKPANLFLIPDTHSFRVKVVDFGIAKSIRGDSTITRTGVLLGSPSYMSPEQVRGQSLDERSDLFSLASVTYELLTGKVAFTAESIPEVLMNVLVEDPPAIENGQIQQVLSSALQKDADKRPCSIANWIEQMLPLLHNAGASTNGWQLTALMTGLSSPASPEMRTERL